MCRQGCRYSQQQNLHTRLQDEEEVVVQGERSPPRNAPRKHGGAGSRGHCPEAEVYGLSEAVDGAEEGGMGDAVVDEDKATREHALRQTASGRTREGNQYKER